jgi:hypothetical protein
MKWKIRYKIKECSLNVGGWHEYVKDEDKAKEKLAYWRKAYPQNKWQMVKITSIYQTLDD